MSPHELKLSGK